MAPRPAPASRPPWGEADTTGPCDALAHDCGLAFDPQGAIADRNPEVLLDLFALLISAARALAEADLPPPPPLLAVIAQVAPLLRSLRHSDAGLPRFHGGDRGTAGRLDTALAASGIRTRTAGNPAMGFARLSAGRTSLILDAAPPPPGARAQASTLAFEMTSGRRPLIVSCGPGAAFGPDAARAARATSCHSTLCLEGHSFAHLPPGAEGFTRQPARVICDTTSGDDGLRLDCAHDGWTQSHGLTHGRTLILTSDGRSLLGEDVLVALDAPGRAIFDRMTGGQGAEFTLRFHLHPDVVAIPEDDGLALVLRSGEVWLFRHDNAANLALAPSVFFDTTRLAPRPAQQVVLSARAMSYAVRVGWSIAKAGGTPQGLRDLASDDGAEDSEDPDR